MVGLPRLFDSLTGPARLPFYDVSAGSLPGRKRVLRGMDDVLSLSEPSDQYRVVRDFEKEFAERFGGGFARAVNSGTSALYLALRAVGAGPGREVITVANTFVSTITAIRQTGARCRFADIDEVSGMMDPASVASLLNDTTAAIVPVHMYGAMADMKALSELATRANVPIVEDACQAIGASQEGRAAGAWGAIGCFSFHSTKLVGSPADGGMVLTRVSAFHDAVCRMAEPDWATALSDAQERMPSRLPPLSVPVLRARLAALDGCVEMRAAQHARYREALLDLQGMRLLEPVHGTRSSWRNVILVFGGSAAIAEALKQKRLPARKIYPQSLALVERIEAMGERIPRTRRLVADHLALPVGEHVSEGRIADVIEAVRSVHRSHPMSSVEKGATAT